MSATAAATEMVDLPTSGRVFTAHATVRLGDVDTRARLRFDALARFLQDVATDDTADAGLDAEGDRASSWVVRRTMVEVSRSAALDERLELRTFCSGTGRSWAERRTSITGADGAAIEAVSLWIRIDAGSGRPIGLGDRFHDLYEPTARGRMVSTRLQLPKPPGDAERTPWPVRRVDLDPLQHVNNAVHWAIVEETLPTPSRRGRAEIEYLRPVDADAQVDLAVDSIDDPGPTAARSSWLVNDATVFTAARWTGAS